MKSTPGMAKAKGHHTTTHQTLQLPRYRKNLVSNKTVTLMVRVLPTDGSPRLQMHKRHVKVATGTAATVKAAREKGNGGGDRYSPYGGGTDAKAKKINKWK